jgi:hypothetical protein
MSPPKFRKGDISLLDPSKYIATYYLRAASGNRYFVSAADYPSALARLHTAFSGESQVNGRQIQGNFQLVTAPTTTVPDDPTNNPPFGFLVHFGQSNNADYTTANIPNYINLAVALGHNFCKTDISINGSGLPSNKSELDALLAALQTVNIGAWGLVSTANRRQSTTTTTQTNPMPEPANGTTYTAAECVSRYNIGYAKGFGLVSTNGYGSKFKYLEAGNEVDTKYIQSGQTGTTFNIANYDTETYKMFFSEMLGIRNGIKAGNASIKVGINGTFTHWGHAIQMGIDAKSTPSYLNSVIATGSNCGWDFYSEHWYNDMEYAQSTAGVKYAGQVMNLIRPKISAYYPSIGLGETGLNIAKSNPNKLTNEAYNLMSIDQYWHRDKCDHYFIYEAFKEPLSRPGDVNIGERAFGFQDANSSTLSAAALALAAKPPFPR